MGLLDDAIREHLELKRRAGADADAVAREEREALGRGGAPGAAPPAADYAGHEEAYIAPDDVYAAEEERYVPPAAYPSSGFYDAGTDDYAPDEPAYAPPASAATAARRPRRPMSGRLRLRRPRSVRLRLRLRLPASVRLRLRRPASVRLRRLPHRHRASRRPRRRRLRGGAAAGSADRGVPPAGGGCRPGRRPRADPRLPRGDARARPPVVRAGAAPGVRLRQVDARLDSSGEGP